MVPCRRAEKVDEEQEEVGEWYEEEEGDVEVEVGLRGEGGEEGWRW